MSDPDRKYSFTTEYGAAVETDLIGRPEILHTLHGLFDFWITCRRNNNLSISDKNYEQGLVSAKAERTFDEMKRQANKHFYFCIRKGDRMVATGKLEIRLDDKGEKRGYQCFLTVDQDLRGKDLAKKLTDAHTEFAKKAGCSHLDADVIVENPMGLVTKFKDSFFLTSIDLEHSVKKFSLTKRLSSDDDKFDKKQGAEGEWQEVLLSDLEAIKSLLEKGYVGIDIKNIGDERDADPKNWKLILEKIMI